MASCNFGALVVAMLMLVASLALAIVAILTDYWFMVETEGLVADPVRRENNYNFGFWRRCYDDIPLSIPVDERSGTDGDCVTIYEDLMRRSDENVTDDEELVIHLSRSYIGLAIASAAMQLATIITLICGSWPGDCKRVRKTRLYVCATIVLLLATMCGIACGVCFIAARDVEEKDMAKYNDVVTNYGWSFMLHWISTGLCLVNGFVILCLLKYSYEEMNSSTKYYYHS